MLRYADSVRTWNDPSQSPTVSEFALLNGSRTRRSVVLTLKKYVLTASDFRGVQNGIRGQIDDRRLVMVSLQRREIRIIDIVLLAELHAKRAIDDVRSRWSILVWSGKVVARSTVAYSQHRPSPSRNTVSSAAT